LDPASDQILRAQAIALGVTIDDALAGALGRYLELLVLWNRRINLSSVRDPAGIVEKHFVDSLAALPHVPPDARTLVDVGSGGGFPGAVLALARPTLAVTLVEPVHKKAAFLEALRRELPLPNVTVEIGRAETSATRADVAISRATWDLLEWLPRGARLVAPAGLVLGMEGAEEHELPPGATRHPYKLGGAKRAIVTYRENTE
jgi:16S rRNA (guanine527-N7)-methyltransferase